MKVRAKKKKRTYKHKQSTYEQSLEIMWANDCYIPPIPLEIQFPKSRGFKIIPKTKTIR
jgi:hypothetical protein